MIKTANSTPTGLPPLNLGSLSSSMQNSSTSSANTNAVLDPKMTPAAPTPTMFGPAVPATPAAPIAPATPKTSIDSMYSPQTGVSTQKTADATYASNILNSVTSGGSIPSSAITSGISGSNVSAKRDSYESMLQQYLDQQKDFQNRYLSVLTPTQAEQDILNKLNQQNTQAALNQEIALNSGETSSFAGGEAQRVARTDAIKQAGVAAQLEVLQNKREQSAKQLEFLINSGDQSFKTQLEMRRLESEVGGIDKQAQDTLYNLLQMPEYASIDFTPDLTKTPGENLQEFRKLVAGQRQVKSEQLTAGQAGMLNSIINQANSSPLIKAADRAVVLRDSISNARNKPKDGYIQQNLVYSYIQALDTYQSAVREGEMKAVSNLDSLFGKFDNIVQQVNNGQLAREDVILQMADASEKLYDSISKAAKSVDDSYKAQANVLGVGKEWDSYRSQFTRSYEGSPSGSPKDFTEADKKALQTVNPATGKLFTQQEIDEYKQSRGFNVVGGDTNQATRYDLTSGLSSMQGLLTPQETVEPFQNTGFGSMGGLMAGSTPIQRASVEIPKTSRLAFVNNNPGNLRFAGQDGARQGEGGFAKFSSPEAGLKALERQISLDASRGLTLSAFINKYAPPTENNTKQYLSQAIKNLGVSANTKLEDIPLSNLTKFIALKESSTKVY